MLTIIPPSTSMNMVPVSVPEQTTLPVFEAQAQYLAELYKKYSIPELSSLFSISETLAQKAYEEFQHFAEAAPKAAFYAFSGALYKAMHVAALNPDEMVFAQAHIRILSSMYGVLKPLDGIRAYRSTFFLKLNGLPEGNLVNYWHDRITEHIIGDASRKNHQILYLSVLDMLKVVDADRLAENNELAIVVFKDYREGTWKIIREYEKPAVANMVTWILRNRIDEISEVKKWKWNGYTYNPDLSDNRNWVFSRKED